VRRSVLRGSNGSVADVAGPSSSSEGGSGSTPGSAPESLSGSEGMAPIKTVSADILTARHIAYDDCGHEKPSFVKQFLE